MASPKRKKTAKKAARFTWADVYRSAIQDQRKTNQKKGAK